MDLNEYRPQADAIPMFQDLPEQTRELVCRILLKIAERSALAKGDVLYEKGTEDTGTGAALVEGAVEVRTDDGEPLTVNAPDLLGEMQLFDEYGERTATVTAAEDSVVLEFFWEEFVGVALSLLTREQQIEVKDMLSRHAATRLSQLSALGAAEGEAKP